MSISERMPALFVGHGSPMNAIEDNRFSSAWAKVALTIPKPRAILSISAHWVTDGTHVNDQTHPKTIYDMYGFPQELYEKVYTPPGDPALANQVISLLGNHVTVDNHWGIDHGTWSVLSHMYPKADVPVVQLSIDDNATMEEHFQTGRKLQSLREQGFLVFGTGNVVHNLALINWNNPGGEPWAVEFDAYIKQNVLGHSYENIIDYQRVGAASRQAFYTTEHFVPLIVILGCTQEDEPIHVFNDECIMGSMSMTSYQFG